MNPLPAIIDCFYVDQNVGRSPNLFKCLKYADAFNDNGPFLQ